MTFLNAGLAGFAVLAAVPILIHLLHRPRPKVQPFPSLIFLQKCSRRSRAISRLRNILLMLLRAAAVAGIAFALARPRIAGAAQTGEEGIAAAIVVDDSFRMAYRDGGLSRFDEARDRALDVIGTLPPGTPTALHFASGDASPLLPDPTTLRAELVRAKPTERAAPLLPALIEAGRALADAKDRRREIHVFTDLARCAWTGQHPDALKTLSGATVYVHDVGREKPTNLAITKIVVTPRAPQAGRPVEVAATVAGWGTSGPVTLVLERGGRREERLVNVAADGGTGVAKFTFSPEAAAVTHGVVRIQTPDPLAPDNERFFAVPVNQALKLLVIEPADAPPYVSFALAPPSLAHRRPTEVTVGTASQDPRGFDAVFIADPTAVAGEHVHRLSAYTAQGGSVILFASASPVANASLTAAGLAPPLGADQQLAEPAHLSERSADHAAFTAFRLGRNGDLSMPEFSRRIAAQLDQRWRPVLRFLDGGPAAFEAQLGRGRVLFFPFALAWTDLPKHPCFVPMLHELARALSNASASEPEALVGTAVLLKLPQKLADPAFSLVDLATGDREQRRAEPGVQLLPAGYGLKPGRYAVEFKADDGPQTRPFAVNIDTSGSDPTRLATDDVVKLLPQSKVLFAYDRVAAAGLKEARAGREFTTLALLLVSLVLLIEVFLASRA